MKWLVDENMEMQAVNYITHHIERLPLSDSACIGERLPFLFQRQEGVERSSQYLRVNKGSVHNKERIASRYESLSNLNESAKTRFDTSHDIKSKSRTICELLNVKDQISTLNESSFSKQKDGSAAKNSKRKRSTDSTGSESSKSICDEEVRRIGLPENRNFPSFCGQVNNHTFHEGFGRSSSPKKRFLSKTDQQRNKTYQVVPCDGGKRRSLSCTSWLPVRLRSCEKKVKVIRIAPLEHREKDLLNFYGERFCEEAFFRPIRADES